jgi:hypothetical protein
MLRLCGARASMTFFRDDPQRDIVILTVCRLLARIASAHCRATTNKRRNERDQMHQGNWLHFGDAEVTPLSRANYNDTR